MTISIRETVFIEEYLQCWNATEAARRAGYKNPNKIGPRKLVEVGVQAAIITRIAELKATTDEVLLRLAAHSRGNMDDFVAGDYLSLDRARERGKMHLIKKMKIRTTTFSKAEGEDVETHDIEVELYDAQAATVQLAKLLGAYPATKVTEVPWEEEAKRYGVSPEQVRQAVGPLFAKVPADVVEGE